MNIWIKKSIEIANSEGYLDKIYDIYPAEIGEVRDIKEDIIKEIKNAYRKKDKIQVLKALFKLPKFPIEHPYVSILRNHSHLIEKNKKVVSKISNRLLSMDVYNILVLASRPKSPSRQLTHTFKRWLKCLNYSFLTEEEFLENKEVSFLEGNEEKLLNFAYKHLGMKNLKRRPDFLLKIGQKYYIGEAKFLTHYGGSQNNQFDGAIETAKIRTKKTEGMALLDGIVWFKSKNYMYKKIIKFDGLALSALLLKDFIKNESRS